MSFYLHLQHAMQENRKIRETQEKIRRAKEAKEKAEKEKQARQAGRRALVDITTGIFTGPHFFIGRNMFLGKIFLFK